MGKQDKPGKAAADALQDGRQPDNRNLASLKMSKGVVSVADSDLLSRMKHFTQAIEQGPVAVIITDVRGLIEYVNPKFEALTGYAAEEVLGKNPSILNSGKTPSNTYADMWSVINRGEEWTGVFHNRKKSGEMFWERAVISGVVDSKNNITHYVAVKEDITKEKVLEEKLEEERLKFFHHSKMAEIGLLASSILHEVSNPIAAIRGLVSEIKDTFDSTPHGIVTDQAFLVSNAYNHLVTILEHTDRLTDITHEISDFTSPQSGDRELIDVNSVIRSSCRLIKFDDRCKEINLTRELDTQLPAIMGIKNQLSHLALNLVINAADATSGVKGREPSICVRTSVAGDNLLMTVTDNGIGMTPEVQAQMFNAFYTTKGSGKGSGLGLSLCHSIVESHCGKIEVESVVNMGTVVRVLLPINNDNVL